MTPPHAPAIAVDTHAHVFQRGLPLKEGRRYTPDYDAPLASYLALLTQHGLSHGVLVQPSFLGTDNQFMLDALAAAQGRLRGVAVVEPGIDVQTLTQMHKAGVRGIRLNLFGLATPALMQAAWQTLLADINLLGWHVEVHMPAERLHEALGPLIASGCRVVVDHFGRPGADAGNPGWPYLLDQAGSGQVWVKLSAAYRVWPLEIRAAQASLAATELLAAFSAARLLWGSDWPHTENQHHAGPVWDELAVWVPDLQTRNTILADTASALFGIEGDKP